MEELIGREQEATQIKKYVKNNRNELIAIYGRRRVGKTFLIRKLFNDQFDFHATGIIDGTFEDELGVFNEALEEYGYKGKKAKKWMDAFSSLGKLLKKKAEEKKGAPIIVFIDELPCFDTRNSRFIKMFGHFWNNTGAWINNIKLFICGSATSWMIRNIINSRGGLHNRVTHEIHLRPFTLWQTEKYLKKNKFRWNQLGILQIYMSLGGVPYYLSLLDNQKTIPENIDMLFFGEKALLRNEFDRLFNSLYHSPENYKEIIQLLVSNKTGMTRRDMAKKLKVQDNGHFGDMLENLIYCDFLRKYNNGGRVNGAIYQITDFFTLFHHQFCKKNITDPDYWVKMSGTPTVNTWYGLTYERVCQYHVREIIHALRFDTIHTEYYSWRSKKSSPEAQIDIIVERADDNISICEVKYSKTIYSINKAEHEKINYREEAFRKETGTEKGIQTCIITTFGLKQNSHSDIADQTITLKDLFTKIP